jgi:hypothetical protein
MKEENKRTLILIFLVIVLLINWFFYNDTFTFFKQWVTNGDLGVSLAQKIGAVKAKRLLMGPLFLILMLFNAGLSMVIIYVYFKKNPKITWLGFKILTIYSICTGVLLSSGYLANNEYVYAIMRRAVDMLASPMVEAVLIPLLKLYQHQINSSTIE